MDIVVEAGSVEIAHAVAGSRVSVELRDIDEDDIREALPELLPQELSTAEMLDGMDLKEIMDYIGIDDTLDYFGVDECVEHFKGELIQDFGMPSEPV